MRPYFVAGGVVSHEFLGLDACYGIYGLHVYRAPASTVDLLYFLSLTLQLDRPRLTS